jgi:hypothetical protein
MGDSQLPGIPVSRLKYGIYFVTFSSDNVRITKNIVLNKTAI